MIVLIRKSFAIWMTVAMIGTVVDHRALSMVGHAHGLGLLSFPEPMESQQPVFEHRHLVLLGIEFGAAPCGSSESAPGANSLTGEFVPSAGSAPIDFDDATGATQSTISELIPTIAADCRPVRTAAVTSASPSCPLIDRTRSGVLRS